MRVEIQYAIRTESKSGEFFYNTRSIAEPKDSLNYKDAVWERNLYRNEFNPTVVSRTVVLVEDPWEEVTE